MFNNMALDGWANQTTLHPLGVVVLLICGLALLMAPRRYALVPMLAMVCCVASAQRVVVATLDFNFLRVMIIFGFARILLRGETTGWRWKLLDTVVTAWIITATMMALILQPTAETLVNRLGLVYDAIGLYFLCRVLVRDWSDVRAFAQGAAVLSIPVAIAFMIEQTTARNMFAVFGGVPEITVERAGRLRCRGPFVHPIVAGAFWAALMPLMAALWWQKTWRRFLAPVGVVCGSVVLFTCASATPLGGLIAGVTAAAVFPIRRLLPWIRWSMVIGVVLLQLVMVNPVWHLLSRMSLVEASTGWYRFKLIDDFIRHFDEWWLIGAASRKTWFMGGDFVITNQYVLQGVDGGLMTFLLFIGIIVCAFWSVGRIVHRAERRRIRELRVARAGDSPTAVPRRAPRRVQRARFAPGHQRIALAWALGTSMVILCAVFVGVSCFGQVTLVWYLMLGFIGSLAPAGRRRRVAAVRKHGTLRVVLPQPPREVAIT